MPVVEFVGAPLRAGGSVQAVYLGCHGDVAELPELAQVSAFAGQGCCHVVPGSFGVADALLQEHEAAAFGNGGQSRSHRFAHLGAQRGVRFQRFGMQFGVAAAQVQPVDAFGQGFALDGGEGRKFHARIFQGTQVFGVVEAEGRVACDCQPQGRAGQALGAVGRGIQRGRPLRQGDQCIQVHGLLDLMRQVADAAFQIVDFRCSDQAKMAAFDGEALVCGDAAQHGDAAFLLDCGRHHVAERLAAPAQDHALHVGVGAEAGNALHLRR